MKIRHPLSPGVLKTKEGALGLLETTTCVQSANGDAAKGRPQVNRDRGRI
ncbi:MAG: hypothetical protein ABSB22_05150 [Thermodesulfobacteriota bacterium]